MKIILSFIVMILFSSFVIAQKKNDLVLMKMQGKVKSIYETDYEAIDKFGEVSIGKVTDTSHYLFNQNGYLVEELKGRLIRYVRDSNTQKILVSDYYNTDGKFTGKGIKKYDNNWNNIESNGYSADGSLEYRGISQYDTKGNETEEKNYGKDGKISTRFLNKYNAKNNKIQRSYYYDGFGILLQSHTFFYDTRDNIILDSFYAEPHNLNDHKTVFKYNIANQKTEEIDYYPDGSIANRNTYQYDKFGNMTERIRYRNGSIEDDTIKWIYSYDMNSNWNKMVVYKNGKAVGIGERKIIYY